MTLQEKQQHLVDELLIIPDSRERLSAVIDRARRAVSLPASERTENNRVRGCVSHVWLVSELRAGRCVFRGDADGPLVKGLVVFLCEFFSGASPADISSSDANPLVALELLRGLSPTRQNGLSSVLTSIRSFAKDHASGAGSAST